MAWKVTICGVEQDGVFTSEECGDKIGALLFMMHGGKIDVRFEGVEDKEASTRKSKVKKIRQDVIGDTEDAMKDIVLGSYSVDMSYDGYGARICCSDILNRDDVIDELREKGLDAQRGDEYYSIDVSDDEIADDDDIDDEIADDDDIEESTRKSDVKKTLIAINTETGEEVPIGSDLGNGYKLAYISRVNEFRYGGGRSGKIIVSFMEDDGEHRREYYDKAFNLEIRDTDLKASTRKSKVNKTRQEFMGEVETAVQKIVKSSAWCQVQVSYDGSGVRVCCSDLLNRGEVISELRARGFDAKEGDDYYAIDVSDADAEDLKASTRKSFSSMVKSQRAKARRD